MQVQTILNRLKKHQGFVYGKMRWRAGTLEIDIRPAARSKPICCRCGMKRPAYDTLPLRKFQFVPLWHLLVFFLYMPRRVQCPDCGIRVEHMPWAMGKSPITLSYAWFLAQWSRRMSWQEVARSFQTSWDTVVRSVRMAVEWGEKHRDLEGISAIGVDEISWRSKGTRFATVVYQIDKGCKRLLWMGKDRTATTFDKFFDWLGEERSLRLRFICSDMWKPYLQIIARRAPRAVNVLDRFHIAGHMSKAIDEIRAAEVKELKTKGEVPVLRHSRWVLLKRPENLSDKQVVKLTTLVRCNLKSVRAYLLKEDFQRFWEYLSPGWAAKFLDDWCRRTMKSRLAPMKKVARMLRNHEDLVLGWFRARGQIALGSVEGFNNKAKSVIKRSYGFRSYDMLKLALYHSLGDLPVPERTHKFC